MKRTTHIGWMAIAWGLWLLSPFWDTFTSSPTFLAMAKVAPEDIWGALALALGLTVLGASCLGWKRVEIGALFGLTFGWGLVAVAYILGNNATLGIPVYTWLCFFVADTATQLFNQWRWSNSG